MKRRASRNALVRVETIQRTVIALRGHNVIIDADLAVAYGVTTRALKQAVKRNIRRFPPDFRFQLTKTEQEEVITNCDHLRNLKFASARPWAFTEHGAMMAASVLNSPRAVEMSVFVVRAFIRLRDTARNQTALLANIDALERRVTGHDQDIEEMFLSLRRLINPPRKPRRQIGFARAAVPMRPAVP
jgi:ORF6N domain-containing protein